MCRIILPFLWKKYNEVVVRTRMPQGNLMKFLMDPGHQKNEEVVWSFAFP